MSTTPTATATATPATPTVTGTNTDTPRANGHDVVSPDTPMTIDTLGRIKNSKNQWKQEETGNIQQKKPFMKIKFDNI